MITLHALQYSRATRVLWLLADLGRPCERVDYPRTEAFRAPEEPVAGSSARQVAGDRG
jgi:glutathione S-transferase